MFSTPKPDEVSIEIDGQEFRFWTSVELTSTLDGHPTVTFTAPFDPDRSEIRETFRPFSFKPVQVLRGGSKVFTGTLVGVTPEVTPDSKTVTATCYSKSAVLEDAHFPAAHYPLQFNGLTLTQIASKLCEPFGLTASMETDGAIAALLLGGVGPDGAPFKKVALEPNDKIQGFLADLAKQRGLVLGSDADGNIVFRKSPTGLGVPVAALFGDAQPVLSVKPNFEPQNYFSELTCIAKTKRGKDGKKYTETNPHVSSDVMRPSVIELDDTDSADLVVATKARMGRMFGNCASYDVELATWFDQADNVWEPGARVVLKASAAMVYSQYQFVIRSVTLRRTSEKVTSASINLVMPGIFSGEIPETLPWAD